MYTECFVSWELPLVSLTDLLNKYCALNSYNACSLYSTRFTLSQRFVNHFTVDWISQSTVSKVIDTIISSGLDRN